MTIKYSCAVLVMGVVFVPSLKVYGGGFDNWQYTVSGKEIEIKGMYPKAAGEIVIPTVLPEYYIDGAPAGEYYPVTSIGASAFSGCTNITSVLIPDGVTSIGDDAFNGCSKLVKVTIPDSVKYIGSGSFRYCSNLVSIAIPNSVALYDSVFEYCDKLSDVTLPSGCLIGPFAFRGCRSLKNLNVPDGVRDIGAWAFEDCESLSSLSIHESLMWIGDGAFAGCSSLNTFVVATDNPWFASVNGLLLSKDRTSLLAGLSGDVIIPECVKTVEGLSGIRFTGLTSLSIPASVKSIDLTLFDYLGELRAFDVASDSSWLFATNGLLVANYYEHEGELLSGVNGNVTIPDCVRSIREAAFLGRHGLTSVIIPNSVTNIGDYAFKNCSGLVDLCIGNGVMRINYGAFEDCTNLVSVTIPNSVTNIGDSAFWGCVNLTDITIPESVVSVSSYAFCHCCNLTSAMIPNSVEVLSWLAFSGCTNLEYVLIPKALKDSFDDNDYDNYAYYTRSPNLKMIEYDGNPPNKIFINFDANGGEATNKSKVMYLYPGVVVGSLPTAYKAGYGFVGWYTQPDGGELVTSATTMTADTTLYAHYESLVEITFDANGGCVALETMKVSPKEPIGELPIATRDGYAFIGWYSAPEGGDSVCSTSVIRKNVTLYARWQKGASFEIDSDGVLTSLEPNGATSIVIPDNVVSIEEWVFCDYCRDIEDIVFPSSVTDIGYGAFYGCTNLVSVTFSEGLKSIGESAFAGCSSLTEVVLPDSLESLGPKSFQGCDSLVSVSIGTGISNVGDGAFGGSSLEDLHLASIDSWLNSVVASPFGSQPQLRVYVNDSLLTDLTIPEGVTTIGEGAFKGWASLQSVRLPESLTSIGEYSFAYCSSLKSINIPDGIVEIPNYAFDRCSNLEEVSIGANVASVGDMAFLDCNCIKRVYISNLSAWCAISFDNRYESSAWANPLYYASEGLWLDGNPLSGAVEIPKRVTDEYGGERDNITYIAPYAFKGCSGITSIKIPSSVTNISQFAFVDCSALQTIYIPKTLENEMQSVSFWQCPSNVERVYYVEPEFTISYGQLKSVKLNGATEVVVPDGVTAIGDWYGNPVFDTPYLEKVVIPDSVMEIRFCAFAGCSELTSIVIPNSVTSIGSQAFSRCPKLDIVVLPRWFQGRESEIFDYDQIPKMRIVYYDGDTPSLSDLNYVTIMFDANGGVVSDDRKECLAGYALGELPEAIFQGFGFKGWYTLRDGGSLVTSETILEADVVLYAHWAECVGIAYDATGGSVAEGLQYVISGEAIGNMPTPVKAGFSFKGWYTSPVGGTLVTVSTVLNSNITLYAHWEEQQFSFEGEDWTQESDGSWKSGCITDYGQTSIIKNVSGAGVLSFSWNVSSESGYDKLIFYIDGESKDVISGTAGGWAEKTYDLDSDGIHTLKWTYSKDGSVSRGDDCGWIKDVVWIAAGYEAVPSIPDDPSAVITGDAENGYTIKPSDENKAVVVTIPDGVEPEKVTVEVKADVQTVKPNGAAIKVVSSGNDITSYIAESSLVPDSSGVVNLATATLDKEAVFEEATPGDNEESVANVIEAVLDDDAMESTVKSAKPGLYYSMEASNEIGFPNDAAKTKSGGATMATGDTVNITKPEKPAGNAVFYRIKVSKMVE